MQHFAVSTQEPEAAAATVKEMFGNPIRFGSDPGRDFSFEVEGVRSTTGLAVATMHFPTPAALDSGELPDYSVSIMEGDIQWLRDGDASSITAPFVVPPGTPARLRWSTTRTQNVGFPSALLAPYTDGPALSISALNTKHADTRAVGATVRMMNRLLRSAPEVFDNPLIESSLLDTLMMSMATAFRLNTGRAEHARPTALRRAEAYMEEHLDQPVSVADIAAAARMSVRGLQALFRRELGVTPLEHLRAARLEAARKDLMDADPGLVAVIARRWGFTHPSRFAAMYRAAFGEYPSTTADRSGHDD